MIRMLSATGMLSLLLAGSASAGVVFEIETTDHSHKTANVSEVSVEGKLLKTSILADPDATYRVRDRSSASAKSSAGVSAGLAAGNSGGSNVAGGDMIFYGDRREMVVVDHRNGSYMVIDADAMKQVGGQMNNAMSQLEEALKNVPEDQRAMIAEMMKQRMPQTATASPRPKSELRRTGETDTKHGYPVVEYEVWQDGRKTRELWVSAWKHIEGGAQAREAFSSFAAFFEELMDAMPKFGQGNNSAAFEHMKDVGGFPVVTREFNDRGELESESALRSTRHATLNPEDFEPPAGYKRQSMPGVRN